MADCKKYEVYGNPTLQQGGWIRTGADNAYIRYSGPLETNYYNRICTLDYVPQHHPTQITITGIASKELEVSMLVLRSDNYIISALGWQDNGYTFNLDSTYDKLGAMFRFKNGDAINPNQVSFDIIGGWVHSLRKLTTDTDTITTLPVDVYADGNTATVGISGNTVQNGTPTPDNPIMPQGTGERTAQLWDISSWNGATAQRGTLERVTNGYKLTATSSDAYTITYGSGAYSYSVIGGSEYTLSWTVDSPQTYGVIYIFTGTIVADTPLTTAVATSGSKTFTVPSGHNYIAFRLGVSSAGESIAYTNIMLNLGSIPLPYEPYGIKIPISSAGQTTPVYLGEVETTRKIKKLVLTGKESWTYESEYTRFYISVNDYTSLGLRLTPFLSNAFGSVWDGRAIADVPDNTLYSGANNGLDFRKIYIKCTTYASASDFKAYLAQQYANGTPVTVWYVLAESETGIVNEQLMKIGDYADTVSDITIPVTAGGDTLSVDTTIQPSEVTVNYTGWHDASVKEWDGSQWN